MYKTRLSNRLARRAGQKGARPATAQYAVEKSATEQTIPSTKTTNEQKQFKNPKEQKIFNCRKSSIISTFNTRTLGSECQLNECLNAAMETKQDIICIQEHRQFHPDHLLVYNDNVGDGWLFVTASSWKNSMNASIGGIGILLSPRAQKSLNQVEKISDRIIIASFNGNPKASVVCCYSPTECSDEQDAITFYTELSSLIRMIPNHNIIMVAGDFNAKLGQDEGFTHSFHRKTNRNGNLLAEMMTEHNLICLNTKFEKKDGKKWIFKYPNGDIAQTDY